MFIFASGSLNYLGYGGAGNLVTAFLLASIPHFLYVNHFLFFFEQSIFPFSFGLMGAGLLETTVEKRGVSIARSAVDL
jgi:hypothetical protein